MAPTRCATRVLLLATLWPAAEALRRLVTLYQHTHLIRLATSPPLAALELIHTCIQLNTAPKHFCIIVSVPFTSAAGAVEKQVHMLSPSMSKSWPLLCLNLRHFSLHPHIPAHHKTSVAIAQRLPPANDAGTFATPHAL